MYRPSFPEDAAAATWGPASSPSPAAAVGRHRTPLDDAPAYDPLLWKSTDNSYISTLATHVMTHQPPIATPGFTPAGRETATKPPLQKFLSSSWAQTPQEDAATRLSRFHTEYARQPTTWVGRALQFISAKLFARWHDGVQAADVAALSTTELIQLMQLALAAGEVDRSAMLARELSRRKLALQMHAFPATPANGATTAAAMAMAAAADRPRVSQPPASPLPQPVGAADYSGFVLRRERAQPTARTWADDLQATPRGRASSLSQPWGERFGGSVHDDFIRSRPVSAERTASSSGETAAYRPLSRSPAKAPTSAATSQYMSDIALSSLHGSENGSALQSDSRWSGRWASSPLQTPY